MQNPMNSVYEAMREFEYSPQEYAVFQAAMQLKRLQYYDLNNELILPAFLLRMQEYISARCGGPMCNVTQDDDLAHSGGLFSYAVEGAIVHLEKIQDGGLAQSEDFDRFRHGMREYVEAKLHDDERRRRNDAKKTAKTRATLEAMLRE